jgi:hypothetical protein
MQPFCQNPQLSRSLESELECAVKSGELKLQSKNLKDFPKHGDRYNLQDTTLAGKQNSAIFSDKLSLEMSDPRCVTQLRDTLCCEPGNQFYAVFEIFECEGHDTADRCLNTEHDILKY